MQRDPWKIANVLRTGYPGAFGWVHWSSEAIHVAGTWDRVSALHIDPGVPMFHAGYDITYGTFFFRRQKKTECQKKRVPPRAGLGWRRGLRPSLRWGQNDTSFESEMLVLSTFSSHFGHFWCPQRSTAPGPAAASDLVFVGPKMAPF